jgi:hypothetical protein
LPKNRIEDGPDSIESGAEVIEESKLPEAKKDNNLNDKEQILA